MTASFPALRLPVHRSVLRFVHDRNPFYLLSALCMFVGFRVVLGALNSAPGDWRSLLGLIATLQLYEVVIIALALFLIVKRGLRRDGWILLGIEALFLVDLTNLNAELFTAMPRLGSVVSGVCFLLAMAKILFVVRTLGLRLSPGITLYIAAQLAFLLGMPGLFRMMQSSMSTISAMQIYSVWWMAALLIAGGAVLLRRSTGDERSPMAALPWRLYVLLPLISLLVHLASENRVYSVHFHPANLGPMVLAVGVLLNQSKWLHSRAVLGWSLGLTAMAVMLSIVPDAYQHDLSRRILGMAVSPLRLILLASAGMLMALAVRHESFVAATASCGCMFLAGLGTTGTEMTDHSARAAHWAWRMAMNLMPETALQWGYVTIAAAFLLLGVGALVSLQKGSPPLLEDKAVA